MPIEIRIHMLAIHAAEFFSTIPGWREPARDARIIVKRRQAIHIYIYI